MGRKTMAQAFITICPRCDGTGRYDRGACFECRPFGACGWVRRSRKAETVSQVTAIRDEAEGRIPWLQVYGASPRQAVEIVRRQMRVKGLPDSIIESVAA